MTDKSESTENYLYYNKWVFYFLVQLFLIFLTARNSYGQHKHDTTHFALAKAEKHSLVFSENALNAVGIDVLLNKIQNVHSTLNRVNTITTLVTIHTILKIIFPKLTPVLILLPKTSLCTTRF